MANNNSFHLHLMTELQNPDFAADFIIAAIKENDANFLNQALGHIVKSYGMSHISEATGLARQALYKMLSKDGNPTLQSMNLLLNAVGLELSVSVKSKKIS